jgi:hypothetical protein
MDECNSTQALAEGTARLAAHAAECDACREQPLPIEPIAALLIAVPVDVDVASLSQRVLVRLQPELARQMLTAAWRRAFVAIALALPPLPIVLAYDAYWLRVAYDFVSTLLPTTIAAYLVLSYAASLLLLFALTYAAIPILVVREGRQRAAVLG